MLIDTHAHLDFPDFAEDLDAVLARAAAAGVTRVITIGTDLESSRRAVALAETKANVFAVIGVHPNAAHEAGETFIEELRTLARSPRVVALGETGFDYYRLPSRLRPDSQTREGAVSTEPAGNLALELEDRAVKAAQATVFTQQLELAVELGLNVVIHERDAWDDTVTALRPFAGKVRAVFHCFGKAPELARELIADGHLVSFTGIVTFKNAPDAQATAKALMEGEFMVETDCPFLAPVPRRGKRCEPADTRHVAEKIAALRGESLDEIARQTTAAAEAFFRLSELAR